MKRRDTHTAAASAAESNDRRRPAEPVAVVAKTIRQFRRSMARRYRIAATRRVLFNLDNHALKDIGLTRGDLHLLNSHRLGEVIDERMVHRNRFELDGQTS